jgi:Mg/Co/Ni transporter MgtE/sporulation protein YlmC with PRC-barrel domain
MVGNGDLYLSEDLLDKQVIDVDGKRLVRVNDIVLKKERGLVIEGIDIGFTAIMRRLGLGKIIRGRTILLPWSLIEAFDYQTGGIKLKLSELKINTLRPADIADILEEVGTKERLGILEAVSSQKAASAIENADEGTQIAIIEQTPASKLEAILDRMSISEVADIFYDINPGKRKVILNLLGKERAQQLKALLGFTNQVAGGLMNPVLFQIEHYKTIAELVILLPETKVNFDAIVVVGRNGVFQGTIYIRDIINKNPQTPLKRLVSDKLSVSEHASFDYIMKLFAQYNLRILPVTNKKHRPVGIITIDSIIKKINEDKRNGTF